LGRYAPAVFLSIGLIWPVSNVLKEPFGNSDKRSMYTFAIMGFAVAIIYGIITKGTEHKDFLDNYFDSLTTNATYYFYLISLIVTTILSFLYPQRIGMVSTAILFGLLSPFLLVGILFFIFILYLFFNFLERILNKEEVGELIEDLINKKSKSNHASSNKVYNSEYDSNGIDSF
jgi:predicted membrane-bound spermidine synthase